MPPNCTDCGINISGCLFRLGGSNEDCEAGYGADPHTCIKIINPACSIPVNINSNTFILDNSANYNDYPQAICFFAATPEEWTDNGGVHFGEGNYVIDIMKDGETENVEGYSNAGPVHFNFFLQSEPRFRDIDGTIHTIILNKNCIEENDWYGEVDPIELQLNLPSYGYDYYCNLYTDMVHSDCKWDATFHTDELAEMGKFICKSTPTDNCPAMSLRVKDHCALPEGLLSTAIIPDDPATSTNEAITIKDYLGDYLQTTRTLQQDEVWNSNHLVQGVITVPAGRVLTINNGDNNAPTNIVFANEQSGITVMKGGRLNVNGALLTSFCEPWRGIIVDGDPLIAHPLTYNTNGTTPNHGIAILNNATLENAIAGVQTAYVQFSPNAIKDGGGGIVQVNGSTFRNCLTGVDLRRYVGSKTNAQNQSFVLGSLFEFLEPFNNNQTSANYVGVSLRRSGEGIEINNNTFEAGPALWKDKRGTASFRSTPPFG
ncbi:MAG: hypothetical protein IPL35_01660 [Sphingobacteriales bacterium]|nr:hypothetical protein [Sphingobacteriales bacterium]